MNKVILVGRITKDIELKGTDTKVTHFCVACQRDFKDKDGNYGADFINCVAFGKNAEFIAKYFSKGSMIGISGRINTGNYTNKDGQKVYTTDVMVEKSEFVTSKSDNSAPKAKEVDDGFLSIPDSVDDVPFLQS